MIILKYNLFIYFIKINKWNILVMKLISKKVGKKSLSIGENIEFEANR